MLRASLYTRDLYLCHLWLYGAPTVPRLGLKGPQILYLLFWLVVTSMLWALLYRGLSTTHKQRTTRLLTRFLLRLVSGQSELLTRLRSNTLYFETHRQVPSVKS